MGYDAAKNTELYLALWKLLDIHFPGHHWLEAAPVAEDQLRQKISKLYESRLQGWADSVDEVEKDITNTLKLVDQKVSPEWFVEADRLRSALQEKALKYSENIPLQVE